jgi:hypothetical protein
MLLQAKALSTAADWAHAYAELAKEKYAQLSVLAKKNRILTKENAVLAKEKDALASVAKEKDAQLSVLAKKNRILTKENTVLANQLAAAILQCSARGSSIGLLGTPVTLVCESLSRPSLGTVFLRSPLYLRCAQRQRRSMLSPRCRRGTQQQQVPSPAPKHAAPFELDRVRAAACHAAVRAASGAAQLRRSIPPAPPARAAELRRRNAGRAQRVRPTAALASTGCWLY